MKLRNTNLIKGRVWAKSVSVALNRYPVTPELRSNLNKSKNVYDVERGNSYIPKCGGLSPMD